MDHTSEEWKAPSMAPSGAFAWDDFQLGFWEPFGRYTNLSPTDILQIKRGETERYGWTFWSFAYAQSSQWVELLRPYTAPVYVLCSDSPSARDPDLFKGERRAATYRYLGSDAWQAMPDPALMKVTNPFKRRNLALAFKVKRVLPIEPSAVPPFTVEWYAKIQQRWCEDRLPTRGEFLIRRGGTQRPRAISAVLELLPPYLAVLRPDPGK